MKKKNASTLFFIELVFSIFFFITVSTICLQIFVKAHLLNEKSRILNDISPVIQNHIELFYENIDNNVIFDTSSGCLYFDSDLQHSDNIENASYCLKKDFYNDDHFNYMNITFSALKTNDVLYRQEIKGFKYN